jgi:hypothetical protein
MLLNSSSIAGVGVGVDPVRSIVHAGVEGLKMSRGCPDEVRMTTTMKKMAVAVEVPGYCWCCLR